MNTVDIGAQNLQRFIAHRQWQQVGRMHRLPLKTAACKRCMVAHPHGLNAFDQTRKLLQVPGVNSHRGSQRQAYAMQTDRVERTPALQHSQCSASVGEEIFGVNLQKIYFRLGCQQFRVVRMAPADAHGWRSQQMRLVQGVGHCKPEKVVRGISSSISWPLPWTGL